MKLAAVTKYTLVTAFGLFRTRAKGSPVDYLTGNAAVSESFCHITIHTIILQRIQSRVSDIKAHNIKT
jgi:hypothetical protein